ncbi:MAG: type II secretion system protein M [Magnetococcales bacterium]|nr:type II secretion system protein M [Magnetococcales bacterium]
MRLSEQFINKAMTTINGLSFRERALLTLTIALIIVLFWFFQLFQPAVKQQLALEQKSATLEKALATLKAIEAKAKAEAYINPNTKASQDITALVEKNARLDLQLKQAGIALSDHQERINIKAVLLKEMGELELYGVEQLAAEPLIAKPINGEGGTTTQIYQHTVKIELIGSYPATWSYLKRLEKSSLPIQWEKLGYQTTNHPIGLTSLTIRSIGLR